MWLHTQDSVSLDGSIRLHSYNRGWGDCSVGKVLTHKPGGLKSCEKLSLVVHPWNPGAGT